MADDWECAVIGGGPAGLGSALVLGRARRRVLVLDRGGQSNRPAAHIGGLLGQEGTAPQELYSAAHDQLAGYDTVELRDEEAVDARAEGDGFLVTLAGGEEVAARVLILAAGMDYEVPDIPGFRELWGGDVFHCPFCHGWEVRDRRVVVYGEGATAERQATLLRAWTDDVTVIEAGDLARLRIEDGGLCAAVRADGTEVPCDAVLLHAPLSHRGGLVESLGLAVTEAGLVEIDARGRTSVPGVLAAGDLAVAPQQVAIAIGSGHLAGITAVSELVLGRG